MDREQGWEIDDWKRLGRLLAEARTNMGLTQVQAGDRIGVTRSPIHAIEVGRQSNQTNFTKPTKTMYAYARLVGWTERSVHLILDGEDPEPDTTNPAEDSATASPAALPGLDRELRTGRTLDYAVIPLGDDEEDDTRLIVAFQSGEDMSDEELEEAWGRWRQNRRRIQALPRTPDTPPES
ncbi:helix-turn-helix transcriptional regulator [Streptomyces sp. NPDC101249]|uniref:helix-turn-helix transcriptional regulator n=1 Tax=Streptomyces sp. NPDC101249 TaxID=3366140 RepID=UPI00381588AC